MDIKNINNQKVLEDWVSRSKRDNKRLFSELDIMLRAIDRFFNTDYLSISSEDLTAHNFYDELIIVRDAILRILGILELIIPENRKNVYWFQRFTETKLLSERKRDAFREEIYRQDTPEKSLYLLYDTFINMKGLIIDLLRTTNISYLSFKNLGQLISKEIHENIFFNPFKKELNPEFDIITNSAISTIVKSIDDRETRKYISVIYLYLFRFLRILGFIDTTSQRQIALNSSLMLLVLLRSEISILHGHIEKSLKKIEDNEMNLLLKTISYSFSMESKRVYNQELRGINRKKATLHIKGKIENSHGILKNLIEQSIVQISQFFNPEIKGEDIFSSFMTKVEQSLRLREDIIILHNLVSMALNSNISSIGQLKTFESLKNYMLYFESFTFRLLRHDDYEEFSRFFNELDILRRDKMQDTDIHKVLEKLSHFKIFLETTLRQIANRSELFGRPINQEGIDNRLKQYI